MKSRFGSVIYLENNNNCKCENIKGNNLYAIKTGSFLFANENNIIKILDASFSLIKETLYFLTYENEISI